MTKKKENGGATMTRDVWPLERIKPYPRNPKLHPPEQIAFLARLLLKYGPDQDIVIRAEDGMILKGHGRRLAALQAKIAEFPVTIRHGLSEEDASAMRIADNQVALLSGFDPTLLRDEAILLRDADFDLTLLGVPQVTLDWITGGDLVLNPDAEWAGMPHFNNPEAKGFRSIVVHFHDQAGVDAFSKAVGLKVNDKTRFLWYPDIEIKPFTKWVSDESKVSDLHREQGKVGEPLHGEGSREDRRAIPRRRGGAGARKVRRGDRPGPAAGAR